MGYSTKANIGRVPSEAGGEAEWADEVNGLRKLALGLWHELQIIESMHSIDTAGRIDLHAEVIKFEIGLIQRALLQTGGHQSEAARLLGISLSSLSSKIKRFGIKVRDPQAIDHIGLAQ
jgi:transcriptional regulator with GAF, ATPase, and Fis domain